MLRPASRIRSPRQAQLIPWFAVVVLGAAPPVASDPSLATLPRARVTVDRNRATLTIELPPADLAPAGASQPSMLALPPSQAVIPLALSLYSARVEVVDSAGRELPKRFLHHFNLTDPGRRDLFLPTSLHLLAASKETPAVRIPPLLLGLPVERGQRLLATAMLSNPTQVGYRGVRVRVVFDYSALGSTVLRSVFPLLRAYPWVMDAQFPVGQARVGRPAFDLPPGRSAFSWESSPAIPGYILGIGGHVHDYAVGLELVDETTGVVLWRATPGRDSAGHVLSMPIRRFYGWNRIGLRIEPSHRYRVTVTYENPTGQPLPRAGMGSVAGLFVPERGSRWPGVDTSNAAYQEDLVSLLVPEDMSRAMAMH